MGSMDANLRAWKNVRALSAVGAEAVPTVDSAFVDLALVPMPRVEIRVRGGALGGGATSVTLAVWRKSEGAVDKLGTFTIASADIATPVPKLFEVYDPNVYITIESFAGGAAQTLTATIEARVVSGS
jgi:hypothetical protein